ncbi:hypothetical protein HMI54_006960 [Coelomomyces lativittatus]|nr:hypothetical protein HMI56_007655 [Coelomomyces lativittatus]KAJ1515897.1 hypothetical protein HMI55_003253 [Coelomomyces lativittatus]KAJ1517117.1 hypothetical protein HMI54_006960 [Coelomomyces lativittatus]
MPHPYTSIFFLISSYKPNLTSHLPWYYRSRNIKNPFNFSQRVHSACSLVTHQTYFKMNKSTLQQPPWKEPTSDASKIPKLKLYNSLTRDKRIFTPIQGRKVTWYNCGPTVYDAAHIGHARLYLTVDVMRRILQDYFNYDIQLVMNITDIDDKIILRARQSHLYQEFINKAKLEGVSSEVYNRIYLLWKDYVKRQFGDVASETWSEFYKNQSETPLPEITTDAKFNLNLKLANTAYETFLKYKHDLSPEAFEIVTNAHQTMISASLDHSFGEKVTDHAIFRDLAKYWESEFMKDMKALGVRPPDVLTRVSEYVPEIIRFVESIIQKGFAYVVDGSVYFDTAKFHSTPGHAYAKLEPWSANSEKLIAEGEGDLSLQLTGKKKATADFALWKRSKGGEPFWNSPWGSGRPGWHIECSVMASAILGEHLDIHTGGIDLAFPHHDNELAQSEACFSCEQWVNYFLHVGHLHVEGQKMSKSLKNFTTIREALQQYSPGQLRLLVLQQHWQGVMDFKASTMQQVQATEMTFVKFVTTIKAILDNESSTLSEKDTSVDHGFHDEERKLLDFLADTQEQVHSALCDNLNTPVVIEKLLELISKTHIYLRTIPSSNTDVLRTIAEYITRMTKIFGLTDMGPKIGYSHQHTFQLGEDTLLPYLQVISKFRDQVRDHALELKDHVILRLCDELRDVHLPKLNVQLDDREVGGALVKLVDPAMMASLQDAKLKQKEAQHVSKLENLKQAQIKKLEKLYAGRVPPMDLFRTSEFSAWDENGFPTLDHEGQPLAKSRLKKLTKEYEAHLKLHEAFLAEAGNIDWSILKSHYESQKKPWVSP